MLPKQDSILLGLMIKLHYKLIKLIPRKFIILLLINGHESCILSAFLGISISNFFKDAPLPKPGPSPSSSNPEPQLEPLQPPSTSPSGESQPKLLPTEILQAQLQPFQYIAQAAV